MLRNVADDALAMWSGSVADSDNVFKFNTIQAPAMANGVGIYGGTNNSATDNYILVPFLFFLNILYKKGMTVGRYC
jgi:hypothetical protein